MRLVLAVLLLSCGGGDVPRVGGMCGATEMGASSGSACVDGVQLGCCGAGHCAAGAPVNTWVQCSKPCGASSCN